MCKLRVFKFLMKHFFSQSGLGICWNMFKNMHSNKKSQTFVLLSWSLLSVFFEAVNLYTFGHTPTNACAIWLQCFSSKANTLSSITLMEFWMLPESGLGCAVAYGKRHLFCGAWATPRTRCVYAHMYLLRGATPALHSLGNTPCFVVEATPLFRSPGNYKIHCHRELIVF